MSNELGHAFKSAMDKLIFSLENLKTVFLFVGTKNKTHEATT